MFRPKLTYDINYFNEYNKNRINRDDIETLHKCNDCGKNNKLYWSEQQRSKKFLEILKIGINLMD
ncbi:MAG TPA: hypothetical protein VLA74_13390 [Nitrososphaeraceae archaeon]|nr:hypothetical protein [Nitrososphaeraceae archaeon]